MAIDRVTGKRIKTVKNQLDIKEEKKQKALPKFDVTYEEELIRQLFEEDTKKQEKVLEIVENLDDAARVHHERPDEEWDVPITEEVRYFDPELSYEITGYRPITMEKGLDFDPEVFCEMKNIYNQNKCYTKFPEFTKPWRDLWNREVDRMNNGMTVGKYRITGDNYYYLNYYRMEVIDENAISGGGRYYDFPRFLSKQYEWFHYLEMAEKLRLNAIALKSRGVGWSEMTAATSVRPYTTKEAYRVVLTAFDENKLTTLKRKCWYQLDWLNTNTSCGLRHVRQKINNDDTKRASKVTRDGTEFGWMSEIHTIVADKPGKIRGDRTDRLIYEEAGSNPILSPSWIQGDSLVELGGQHFGTKIGLGTGGDDMALSGLADAFRNPAAFKVLPFKNYDTYDGKPELTAFFLPAHKFALTSKYLDSRGVTNHIEFKKYYEAYRKTLSGQKYLDECAEHCFVPEEALSKTGANVFDTELVSQQMVNIKIRGLGEKITHMQLEWDKTSPVYSKVNAYESSTSKIQIVEPPLRDPEGNVWKNLYVAGIDSIDLGTDNSATDDDVSDFCIVIKRRVFGDKEPKYVAMYKDRPRDIRAAYMIALKLLTWYNCPAMLEFTKISFQQFLRDRKKENLLMSRPEYAVSTKAKRNITKRLIGVPSTEAVIKHGLELVQAFLSDYYYSIDYPEMLEELLKYTYDNKRKFDIIASLQMAEIGDEALTGITPIKQNNLSKEWKDFGWYTDEHGYRKFGVIPTKKW